MEQILPLNKSIAFIPMDEYLELLKMKEEIIKNEKIITFEIEKDKYHTKTIEFAYITKDDSISEISVINNNLYDEITNLRSIIKANNDKFNNIESQNRDLSAMLSNFERTITSLTNEIKINEENKDVYYSRCFKLETELSETDLELALLKDMSIFEILKWKFNKNINQNDGKNSIS